MFPLVLLLASSPAQEPLVVFHKEPRKPTFIPEGVRRVAEDSLPLDAQRMDEMNRLLDAKRQEVVQKGGMNSLEENTERNRVAIRLYATPVPPGASISIRLKGFAHGKGKMRFALPDKGDPSFTKLKLANQWRERQPQQLDFTNTSDRPAMLGFVVEGFIEYPYSLVITRKP